MNLHLGKGDPWSNSSTYLQPFARKDIKHTYVAINTSIKGIQYKLSFAFAASKSIWTTY